MMGKVSSSCTASLAFDRSCDPSSNLVWHLGNWLALLPRLAAYAGSCGALAEVFEGVSLPKMPTEAQRSGQRWRSGNQFPEFQRVQHPTSQMRRERNSTAKRPVQPDRAKQDSALGPERVFYKRCFSLPPGAAHSLFEKREWGKAAKRRQWRSERAAFEEASEALPAAEAASWLRGRAPVGGRGTAREPAGPTMSRSGPIGGSEGAGNRFAATV